MFLSIIAELDSGAERGGNAERSRGLFLSIGAELDREVEQVILSEVPDRLYIRKASPLDMIS